MSITSLHRRAFSASGSGRVAITMRKGRGLPLRFDRRYRTSSLVEAPVLRNNQRTDTRQRSMIRQHVGPPVAEIVIHIRYYAERNRFSGLFLLSVGLGLASSSPIHTGRTSYYSFLQQRPCSQVSSCAGLRTSGDERGWLRRKFLEPYP